MDCARIDLLLFLAPPYNREVDDPAESKRSLAMKAELLADFGARRCQRTCRNLSACRDEENGVANAEP